MSKQPTKQPSKQPEVPVNEVAKLFGVMIGLALAPIFALVVGAGMGLLVMWSFGGVLADGLNVIFNTARFHSKDIFYIIVTLFFLKNVMFANVNVDQK